MNKISPAWLVVGLLALYILFLQMCPKKGASAGSSVTVDTAWIINKYTSGWTKPKPDTIKVPRLEYRYRDTGSTSRVPYPVFIDTSTYIEVRIPPTKEDTLAIIQQYLTERKYKDSFKLKYGKVWVEDVVSRNEIQQRKWTAVDSVPVVTKTRKPRLIYLGGGGYTPLKRDSLNFISAAEVDLGFQNRRGQAFEGSLLFSNRPVQVGIKFKQPIFTSK